VIASQESDAARLIRIETLAPIGAPWNAKCLSASFFDPWQNYPLREHIP